MKNFCCKNVKIEASSFTQLQLSISEIEFFGQRKKKEFWFIREIGWKLTYLSRNLYNAKGNQMNNDAMFIYYKNDGK